jgi:asparagine synthetase B (glutamine-hydrolysing)
VGFGHSTFDERIFARQMAERYGTHHTELMVEAPATDIAARLVWHFDEPFGDSSAVPSYAIAELTRQHVTVVLNGDGADEIFAGYDWYKMDRLIQRGQLVPLEARRWFSDLMQRLPANCRKKNAKVRVMDNASIGKVERLRDISGSIEFLHADLADSQLAEDAVRGMEYVIHQAAVPSVLRSIQDPIRLKLIEPM